jgi:hypothetical protein
MSPAATSAPPNRLALLLSLSALLLVASGVAYWVFQNRPQEKAHSVPVDALYGLALDAGGAVAGDPAAQSRFQERQKALEDAAAKDSAAPFTSDARFRAS